MSGMLFWAGMLTLLSSAAPGEERWALWKGETQSLGSVAVRSEGGVQRASILDAAKLLHVQVQIQKNALLLLSNSRKASFVPGDVMVFVNGEIFPLTAPIRKEGSLWWAEVHGMLKVLEMLLYGTSPPPVPLRWRGGGAPSPTPSGAVLPVPSPEGSPEKASEETSTAAMLEEWRRQFAPEASSKEHTDLRRLRWKEHPDKVRLVLDMVGKGFPRVQKNSGKITLLFSNPLPESFPGSESPYPQKITCSRISEKSLLLRHHAERVETFSLSTPPRFVVDFFYASPQTGAPLISLPTPAPKTGAAEESLYPEIVSAPSRTGKPLVVIDAGHGGKDPGAVAHGLREKDINLAITGYLSTYLRQKGCTVLLTRKDDRYPRLRERTDFANRNKADVFVSIHVNALPKGRHAKGIEIYIMALPSDKDAMELAKFENREVYESNGGSTAASDAKTEMLLHILGDMQQNAKITESMSFAEVLFRQGKIAGLPMRRVAQAPFFVLRGAGMPSVLVETGFLTEKSEAAMLRTPGYQKKIALALGEGILKFIEKTR